MSKSSEVRESKDISRAELIFMIAKLRGMLYTVLEGKRKEDWTDKEVQQNLQETLFNISYDTEDNVDWDKFR